jgi:hypothetical protein
MRVTPQQAIAVRFVRRHCVRTNPYQTKEAIARNMTNLDRVSAHRQGCVEPGGSQYRATNKERSKDRPARPPSSQRTS